MPCFTIRNYLRSATSTSRRVRLRLEALEERTAPAYRFANTHIQAIDRTCIG
jgi:hypothetical protein